MSNHSVTMGDNRDYPLSSSPSMDSGLICDVRDPLMELSAHGVSYEGAYVFEPLTNPAAVGDNPWDGISDFGALEPTDYQLGRDSTFAGAGIEAEAKALGYVYEQPSNTFDATAVETPFLSEEVLKQAVQQQLVESVIRVVLAHIGKGTTLDIYNCAAKYNLLKDAHRPAEKMRGDFTNRINQDRKRPNPLFGTEKNGRKATHFLTEFGRKITANEFGLFSMNAIPNSDLPFDNAIERILTTYGVMSRDDIEDAFVRDGYCTKSSVYALVNEEKVIRQEIFRPWVGQTLSSAQRMKDNSRASGYDRLVFHAKCFRGYWWIDGHDYRAQLFSKLEEQNPYQDLGAEVFQARVQMRIDERVGKKARTSQDKLRALKFEQKSAYDMRDDALNLWIPEHASSSFFEQHESRIPGAGNGLYAKVDLPPYTCLEVLGERRPTDHSEWHPYAFGYTEQDNSHCTIFAGTEEGGASCTAALMNDSLVGQQFSCHQIVIGNTIVVYLMNEQTIKAGDECFFGYGEDYWTNAPFAPEQAPIASQTQCIKKRAAYVVEEPQSKRNKGSYSLSPGYLPEPLFSSEELLSF